MSSVQSLDRAFDILELLALENRGLGVTEIGSRLSLHKSTVHRLLSSLGERGYIEKNQQLGVYKLGLKIVELGSIYLNNVELKTEAAPILRRLASQTTQPVHLATYNNGEVIYIDKVDTVNSIRMYSSIGKRVPLHCSGVGKVLLSDLGDNDIIEILNKSDLIKCTSKTITDINKILKEIDIIRRRGWAVDNCEHEENIRCIAAPIYDYRNKMIAAVSTSGPNSIISEEKDSKTSECVIEAAKDISKRMGYQFN